MDVESAQKQNLTEKNWKMKKTGYKTAILIVLAVLVLGGHALAPRGGPAAGPRGGPAPELRCGGVAGQENRKLYGNPN